MYLKKDITFFCGRRFCGGVQKWLDVIRKCNATICLQLSGEMNSHEARLYDNFLCNHKICKTTSIYEEWDVLIFKKVVILDEMFKTREKKTNFCQEIDEKSWNLSNKQWEMSPQYSQSEYLILEWLSDE